MKLSMWILYDWLRPFTPTAQVDSGRPVLRNARHFSEDVQIERQNVYIGREREFFPTGGNGIICVNGNDSIRLATDDYEAVFNAVLRAFDFYNSWSDDLRDKVIAGCTLQDLADDSEAVFGDPFFIQDRTYKISAYSTSFKEGSLDPDWNNIVNDHSMRPDRIAGINNLIIPLMKAEGPFVFKKGYFPFRSICQNVFLYGKHTGWFVLLEHHKAISEGRKHLVDTFVHVIEYWMEKNDDKKARRANTGLFLDILDGKPASRDDLARSIDSMDWRISDEYCIVQIACLEDGSQDLAYLAEAVDRSLYGCCTVPVGLSLMVIVNLRLRRIDEMAEELGSWMQKSFSRCGISNPCKDLGQLAHYYEQARIALAYGAMEAGKVSWISEHALAYAMNVLKMENADTIRHRALDKLYKYDREHGTSFYETLRVYILNERNLVRTAEAMFLHRNSLYYRINRILEITDLDLDDQDTRLHILLSYHLDGQPQTLDRTTGGAPC